MKRYIDKFIKAYVKSFIDVYTTGKITEKIVYTIGNAYAVMLIPYIMLIHTGINIEIAALTFILALVIFSIVGITVSIRKFTDVHKQQ